MNYNPVIFSLFGQEHCVQAIHQALGYDLGIIEFHQFPDDETVVQISSVVEGRDVIMVADLAHPNSKLLPLLFAAETAKDLGARKIGLILPYLPYMRQDIRFRPGESITSRYFAKLISSYFDGLLTVDPHLHRWHALSDIYSISAKVLHANTSIAAWIMQHVSNPVLIGPDEESAQWVGKVAEKIKAPFLILKKIRQGDSQVKISCPELERYRDCTPVLVDDIISSAGTMIETIHHLSDLKMPAPLCITVHALFSDTAYANLLKAGAKMVISTNTIKHPTNEIGLEQEIIQSINKLFS